MVYRVRSFFEAGYEILRTIRQTAVIIAERRLIGEICTSSLVQLHTVITPCQRGRIRV